MKKEYLTRKSRRVLAAAMAMLLSVSIFAQALPRVSAANGVSGTDAPAAAQTETAAAPENVDAFAEFKASEAEDVPEVVVAPEDITEGEQIDLEVSLFAEDEQSAPAEEAVKEIIEEAAVSAADEPVSATEVSAADAEELSPAFSASRTLDGWNISVSAPEGVIPEGAELRITRVNGALENKAERVVNALSSIMFDLTLVADGEVIQPDVENGLVQVSVCKEGVVSDELKIYHFNQSYTAADDLDVTVAGSTATVEVEHFSSFMGVVGDVFTLFEDGYIQDGDKKGTGGAAFVFEVLDMTNMTVSCIGAGLMHGNLVIPAKVRYDDETVFTVTQIGKEAFQDYSPAEIAIPDTVVKIGEAAFYNCWTTVKTVTIPSSVSDIGESAFAAYDTWIDTVILEGKPAKVGETAFVNMSVIDADLYYSKAAWGSEVPDNDYGGGLWNNISPIGGVGDSFYTDKDGKVVKDTASGKMFFFTVTKCETGACEVNVQTANDKSTEAITIPEKVEYFGSDYKVTALAESAFYKTAITGVTLPSTVNAIPANAFEECAGLTSVTIPENVTSIGAKAFGYCTNLAEVTFASNKAAGHIADNAFISDNTQAAPGKLVLPDDWGTTDVPDGDNKWHGGYYTTAAKFSVGVDNGITGGTVTPDMTEAESGDTVKLTIEPSTGYEFKEVTVTKDGTSETVPTTKVDDKTYTFEMPENDVTVSAVFEHLPDGSAEYPWLIGKNDPADVKAVYDSTTKTLTITGTGATMDWTIIALPEWSGSDVQHLVVESGVTALGAMMFWGNSAITTADLGGVTEIGNMAFFSATNLKSVTANSLETAGSSAFSSCKLENVDFPKLTTAGSSMFNNNTALKSVSLPELTVIPDNCFASCSALEAYDFTNVTSIGQNAFNSCKALTDINIPGKTAIGSNAFAMCQGVESLNIPNVTSLGKSAFSNAGPTNGIGVSKYYSVTLSPELTSIPDSCFASMWGLNEIVYQSESMPTIGQLAFFNLTADVYIPMSWLSDTLTLDMLNNTSGDYQYRAKKLTYHACYTVKTAETANGSVSSDKALAELGDTVALEAAPATGYEFVEWKVTDKSGNPVTVTDDEFTMPASDVTVSAVFEHLPDGSAEYPWLIGKNDPADVKAYFDKDTKTLTIEGTGATKDWTSTAKPEWSVCDVQKVVVKSGVTALGNSAFDTNRSITAVDLGGVTEIGTQAFYNTSNLKNVTANSLEKIGYWAFARSGIESISLPNVTTADIKAFESCTKLKSASLPKLADIPEECFYYCNALEAYDFSKVASVGKSAFYSCNALTSIDIPGNTAIGEDAFRSSTGVKSVSIPNVTTMGNAAFASIGTYNTPTEAQKFSITLSPELTELPMMCFSQVKCLNKVVYTSASMPKIGDYAFMNVTADVYIPASWLSDTLTLEALNKRGADGGQYQYSALQLTYHAYYTVKTAETANGSVSSDKALAESGETVALEAAPATGYEFVEWKVTDKSGNPVTVTDDEFTMPASDVTVSAVFKKPQTITAPASITVTYGTPVSIEASTDGDGALSYVSNKTASCTVDSTGKVTFVAADSSADNFVTVKAAATDTCAAAEAKVAVKTVKASATFEFDPADTVTAYSGETAAQVNARVNAKLTGLVTGDVTTDYGTPYVEVLNKESHTPVSDDEELLASKEYISSAEIYGTGTKKNCYNVNKSMIQRDLPVVLREQEIAADSVTVKLGATGKSVSGTVSEKAVEDVAALTGKFGTLSYVVADGTDVITIDALSGAITTSKTGQATVTVTAAANAYYKEATKTVTVTVTEKNVQTVTASAPATLYVGDNTQKVTASTDGDGDLSYTAAPADVVSVDANGTITALKPGEATITVTAAETTDYAEGKKEVKVNVAKRTQAVEASDMTIADTDSGANIDAIVSEVAVSGVPALLGKTAKPVFTSSDDSIATVDEDGVITVNKPGKVTISMTLPGNDFYNEVTVPTEVTLTIEALEVIEGEDSKYKVGSKEGLQFRANGAYDNFLYVKVDDAKVDSSNYTAWEGSTYVKFTTKYLDSLATGKHKLTYVYKKGECSCWFYVERPSGGNGGSGDVPKTQDTLNVVLWSGILLLSVAAVVILAVTRKKNRSSDK